MRIVDPPPIPVREIETVWIPLSDGCRVAARLWLPEDAERQPVPALFEYIPYRRRDFTRARDEPIHRYFAGRGYASLRVDIRGSGDSDGLQDDEFLDQEQLDGIEVIDWIAAQRWSSGAVGMFGKSWGGINALQIAARRPAALRAILSVASTDDRYIDTDHYLGGSLTDVQMIWGGMFLAQLRRPPDPDVVGERWREMWLRRLANAVQPMENWFEHQRRDDFWNRGSICRNFAAVRCATFLVGGWLDGFSSSIFRMLAGLECPRKALVGPWGHQYPHDGWPGPAIGFLQEAVRWWDHWLKGRDTGIMDEPMLRVWMQESGRPDPEAAVRPGRWVSEDSWPSPRIEPRRYALNSGRLARVAAPEEPLAVSSPQTIGLASRVWTYIEHQAADQREDDLGSLCFDSSPLEADLEILGAPVATLALESDRRVALVAVRVNDLAPDGGSLLVSRGVLNLTRRDSHEHPAPLVPGQRCRVRVQLDEAAHCFRRGHRVRVAISTSYWHLAWPPPERATLTLYSGASVLDLPVRPRRPDEAGLAPFGEPESARPMAKTILRAGRRASTIDRDGATVTVTHTVDGGAYRIEDHGLVVEELHVDRFAIREDDPLSAAATVERRYGFARGSWSVRIEARVALTATRELFRLRSKIEAYEGEVRVDSKEWDRSFERDLM